LVGEIADQYLHRRRRLLEPGGNIDRVAIREALVGVRVGGRDDLASVDAHPCGERDPVCALEIDVDPAERFLHVECGADRPDRIVLADLRQPEHGHDRVADVLLDLAAVLGQDVGHHAEVAVLDLVQGLWIDHLPEGGGALQVREDDRDGLPQLLGRQRLRQGRAAIAAQAELRRVFLATAGADLHLHFRSINRALAEPIRRSARCRQTPGARLACGLCL
jgi:hypothetical protein